jgi:hypothetical protein
MSKKIIDVEDDVRDGIETLPEMMDVRAELAPVSKGVEAAIGRSGSRPFGMLGRQDVLGRHQAQGSAFSQS